MKRLHVNLRVSDLDRSTEFYTRFFGAAPTVAQGDYRKWMLDDPFINFSIEPAEDAIGIAHLGIQAANDEELEGIYTRIAKAAGPRFEEGETECCYAHSHKNWTADPDGIIWEAFFTDGQRKDYGTAVTEKFAHDNAAPPEAVPEKEAKQRCC